jgi:hypothetical protein
MSVISGIFQHIKHLFVADVKPTVEAIIQPEIDLMHALLKKFANADLTTVANVALAVASGNVAPANALASVAHTLKATALAQVQEATEEEITLFAHKILQKAAKDVNTAVATGVAAQNAAATPPA